MNFFRILKKSVHNIYVKYYKSNKSKGVFYIGGNESLPPPLDKEEEEAVIRKYSLGDISSKNILIERNLRLVVYIAKKFENVNYDIEDLISIGTIGLLKAINSFDRNKNIKLATYASRCIENEILMYLRKNNKSKNEVSFNEPLNQDGDGNELLLSDILGTENDVVSKNIEDEVDKKLLKGAMERLNNNEKKIMMLRFGFESQKEKTQKEVADMMGISQSYISRLEKKIINKIKQDIKSKTC